MIPQNTYFFISFTSDWSDKNLPGLLEDRIPGFPVPQLRDLYAGMATFNTDDGSAGVYGGFREI